MDTSYGNLSLKTRARDILKGLGLTPCTASVNYVTEQVMELLEYVVNLSVEELHLRGLLRSTEKTASLQYPPAVIYL